MDSWPPATTAWLSPALMDCAASMTALSPEPHTLLMVSDGIVPGSPAPMAAWRAGACPAPPCTTWPMITSSTSPAAMPARLTVSLIAIAPSCGAVSGLNAPWNFPIGVRVALTMTGVRFASTSQLQTSARDAFSQAVQEFLLRNHVLLGARAAGADRDSPPGRLPPADYGKVRNLRDLALADLVVQRLVAVVQVR